MKLGVTTSLFAHAAAVAFGLVSLSSPRPLNVAEVEALPVDIIPIESITKTVQGDLKADPKEKPAPKQTTKQPEIENAENVGDAKTDKKADAAKVTEKPAVEKTSAPSEKVEAPKPEPKPAEPTPDLAPEPKPKTDIAALVEKTLDEPAPEEPVEETFAELKQVVVPKRRPQQPKPERAETAKREKDKKLAEKKAQEKKKNDDKIAALVNKEAASAGGAKRSDKKAGLGTKKGNNAVKLSQSEIDALRGQIQSCWNVGALAGSDDAETLRARVEFRLKPDGTIDGKPTVSASGGSKRSLRTFSGSAKRAIVRCAPYELPRDKYEDWADVVVNFSLKDML